MVEVIGFDEKSDYTRSAAMDMAEPAAREILARAP